MNGHARTVLIHFYSLDMNTRQVSSFAGLLFGALLLGAGCFGSTTPVQTPTPAQVPTTPTSATDGNAPTAPEARITIQSFAFTPQSVTVSKGTKVTWSNNDSVAHTVVGDSGTPGTSGSIAPGATYSYTFTQAGTFTYHCGIHPSMTGTITVTP